MAVSREIIGYIILFIDGVHPCGTDFTTALHYKYEMTVKGMIKISNQMIDNFVRRTEFKNKIEGYYLSNCNYSQRACEMNSEEFYKYIKQSGKLVSTMTKA